MYLTFTALYRCGVLPFCIAKILKKTEIIASYTIFNRFFNNNIHFGRCSYKVLIINKLRIKLNVYKRYFNNVLNIIRLNML